MAAPLEKIENEATLLLLKEWSEIRAKAAELAIRESELRDQLFNNAFPEVAKDNNAKGTFNKALPNGWKLKLEAKFNVNVDKAVLSSIKQNLIDVHKVSVDEIFSYTPQLSLTEYNKQSDAVKKLLSNIVTFKRGKPSIELIAPKTSPKDIES